MRSALVQALKGSGYQVESAENGLIALQKALNFSFDLIVTDIRMPGMDGVSMVTRVKQVTPCVKTVVITGYADDEPIVRALNLGVDALLKKPFNLKEFLRVVSVKLEEKEREEMQEIRDKNYRNLFSKIVENLGEEKAKTILGDDVHLPLRVQAVDLERLAVLTELGRMAEIRQEFDVAIQTYEEGLVLLSHSTFRREEFAIRMALSGLFEKKPEAELAFVHAAEALTLAEQLQDPALLIDANHHLAKLFLNSDPDQSLKHLNKAQSYLTETHFKERQAMSWLLFAAFWVRKNENEKAKEAVMNFLSFGKRHFLPQGLVSLLEFAWDPFLLALEERLNLDTALWVLEEAAPLMGDKLNQAVKANPNLLELLSPFLPATGRNGNFDFEIYGFGKLAIIMEGNALIESQWRSLKGRSLFFYLVHEYPKVISEEHLLDTFWPSLNIEKGKHAFRTTLYFLRRLLGSKLSKRLLYAERQKYGIQWDPRFSCDFLAFRNYYQQSKNHWEKGDRTRAVFTLKEAEKLYKGEFLQGWSEEWALSAREEFKEAFTWTLMALAVFLCKQQAWPEALVYAKKAVQMDPALEEAHSLSMQCFLEIGKRDEAVKQFHFCKEVLKTELNLSPSQTLIDLYLKAIDARPVVELSR